MSFSTCVMSFATCVMSFATCVMSFSSLTRESSDAKRRNHRERAARQMVYGRLAPPIKSAYAPYAALFRLRSQLNQLLDSIDLLVEGFSLLF
jgi:hypothetical protein